LFNSSAFPIDSYLRTALTNAGFDVVAARYSWNSWFNDNSINVELECNVYNEFTSEQARQNAIRAIEAYTANFGTTKVFHNTTLSVTYDGFARSTNGGPTVPLRTQISPPSSFDSSVALNSTGQSMASDAFFTALGISTPVALVGGGLLLILLLRR
jgi:hypothetical protein